MPRGRLIEIVGIKPYGPRSASADLPGWAPAGDDESNHQNSTLRLFENDVELGPGHTEHALLDEIGGGAFSHWRNEIYFTSSDGANPAENGRRYTALVSTEPLSPALHALQAAEPHYDALVNTAAGYAVIETLAAGLEPGMHLSERGRSFFQDEDFAADFRRFENRNFRSFDRKFVMRELARHAARLPGDMAECGVYLGGTAWLMAKALLAAGRKDAHLHLFDSFAGLSDPAPIDGASAKAGDLAAPITSVRERLEPVEAVIQYWPGWIPNEFPAVSDRRFSLVHIDVDLANPTLHALEFFYPRLIDRGMLVCDDYGFETSPGVRAAVDAFALENGVQIIHLPTGQGLIIAAPK